MAAREERERALEQHLRAREFDQAALVARELGDPRRAAGLFFEANMPYEAAVCFYEAGDRAASLASFLKVPRDSYRHRAACVHAIRLASELGSFTFELDNFVTPFAESDPATDAEKGALHRLAELYRANDFQENADECVARLARVDPRYLSSRPPPAATRTPSASFPPVPDAAAYAAISREDASFWRTRPASESPRETSSPMSSRPPDSASAHLPPGSVIAGRYRLEAELGRGGMGVVYRATDLELGESIAIKLFSRPLEDSSLVSRFKLELMLCRQLAHPNIVRLYDIGAHEGRKFISMELLSGASLRFHIRRGVLLSSALGYFAQLAAGLGAAHEKGVVHRDVKPDNVFVTEAGVVKLMDFGLAKREEGGEAEPITVSGFLAGTPGYMAPEQVADFATVTRLADIYALGVVAYELLTWRKPYYSKDKTQLMRMQLTEVPPGPRSLVPAVPFAIDQLVSSMIVREPERRPQSCAEVLAVIEGK